MLTLRLMEDSMKSIIIEVESIAMNSGELLRRGTVKFSWMRLPLDAILHRDNQQSAALLPDNLLELRVVGIVGYPENSGELTSAW
jgi:hypothetical protein